MAPRLTKGGRHERFPVCQIPDLQWDFRAFLIPGRGAPIGYPHGGGLEEGYFRSVSYLFILAAVLAGNRAVQPDGLYPAPLSPIPERFRFPAVRGSGLMIGAVGLLINFGGLKAPSMSPDFGGQLDHAADHSGAGGVPLSEPAGAAGPGTLAVDSPAVCAVLAVAMIVLASPAC